MTKKAFTRWMERDFYLPKMAATRKHEGES